jgi:hypothetical protein
VPSQLPGLRGLSGLRGLPGLNGNRDLGSDYFRSSSGGNSGPPLPEEYAINQDEIAKKQKDIESGGIGSILSDILSLPGIILGGEAIKGGLLNGTEGFVAGLPTTFLADLFRDEKQARKTSFSEIREKYGWTQDSSVANFAIDAIGEIASSPGELLINPFGSLAKSGEEVAAGLVKGMQAGQRAAAVFKIPFTDIILGSTKGIEDAIPMFKSMAIMPAKALDSIGSAIRTSPYTKPLFTFFSKNLPVANPEAAAEGTKLAAVREAAMRQVGLLSDEIMTRHVGREGLKELAKKPEYFGLFDALRAHGIVNLGDASGIFDILDNSDVYLRLNKRARLLATDEKFSGLWNKVQVYDDAGALSATGRWNLQPPSPGNGVDFFGEGLGTHDEAKNAIRQIYKEYKDIPLPEHWLEFADLKPRVGAELSIINTQSTGQKMIGLLRNGDNMPVDEAARQAIEASTPNVYAQVLGEARDKLKGQLTNLYGEIEKGTVDKNLVEGWLGGSKEIMQTLAKQEALKGILDQSFELFQGPYLFRQLTPETKALIDGQVKQFFGSNKDAFNLWARFAQERSITDMTTFEVNAIMEHIGTNVTGYQPLNKLRDYSTAETLLGKIFDNDFVRRMMKINPNAAEGFRLNPFLNDWSRILESSKLQGRHAIMQAIIDEDSPLRLASKKISDIQGLNDELFSNPGRTGVIELKPGQGIAEVGKGALVRKAVTVQNNARYTATRYMVRDFAEKQIASKVDNMPNIIDDLNQTIHIAGLNIDEARATVNRDSAFQHLILRDHEAINAADTELARLEEMQKYHRDFGGKTAPEGGNYDPAVIQAYNDHVRKYGVFSPEIIQDDLVNAKNNLLAAKDGLDLTKQAMEESYNQLKKPFDDLIDSLNIQKGKEAADIFATKERIQGEALRKIRELNVVKSGKMTEGEIIQNIALQQQFAKDGVLSVDGLKNIPTSDGRTLFDVFTEKNPDAVVHIFNKDELEGVKGLIKNLEAPDPLRQYPLFRVFDRLTQVWKSYTSINPVFLASRARDAIQNHFSLMLGGFSNYGRYGTADEIKTLIRKSLGTNTPLSDLVEGKFVTRAIDGAEVPMKDVIQAAQIHGMLGPSGFVQDIGHTAESALVAGGKDPGIVSNIMDAIVPNPFKDPLKSGTYKAGAKLAQGIDEYSKVAGWLDQWDKGASFSEAAAHVSKWLYDPRTVTTASERYWMGRVIPFYSFQKYAISQAVGQFFEQPGTVTWLEKLRKTAYTTPPLGDERTNGEAGKPLNEAQMATVMPQFIKDGLGIPYKVTDAGPSFSLFGSYFTVGEISKLAGVFDQALNPDPSKTVGNAVSRYLVTNMNPILKTAIETIYNRDFYSDRPIQQLPGEPSEIFGKQVNPYWRKFWLDLRFVNDLNKMNIINLPEAKVALNAVDRGQLGSRREMTPAETFLGSALNPIPVPKLIPLDVANDYRYQQANDNVELQNNMGKLRRIAQNVQDQGKTPTKEDADYVIQTIEARVANMNVREALRASFPIDEELQRKSRLSKLINRNPPK